MNTIEEMAQEIATAKDKNGYTRRLHKVEGVAVKAEKLSADIVRGVDAVHKCGKDRVNWADSEDVLRRIETYMRACAQAGAYPSMMGLAVYGFGVSRQAMNEYRLTHPGSAAAELITQVSDIFADILVNGSLKNDCNVIQAIFQLKNHFQHSDKVEISTPAPYQAMDNITAEDIAKRYMVDVESESDTDS